MLLKGPPFVFKMSKQCDQPVACAAPSRCSKTVAVTVLVFTMPTTLHEARAHTEDRNPRVQKSLPGAAANLK